MKKGKSRNAADVECTRVYIWFGREQSGGDGEIHASPGTTIGPAVFQFGYR